MEAPDKPVSDRRVLLYQMIEDTIAEPPFYVVVDGSGSSRPSCHIQSGRNNMFQAIVYVFI